MPDPDFIEVGEVSGGTKVAVDEMTINGDVVKVQLVRTQGGTLELAGTTITTTAIPLFAAPIPCSEVLVQMNTGNTDTVYIGTATTQAIIAEAGSVWVIPCHDVQDVWVKANSGSQGCVWMASVKAT